MLPDLQRRLQLGGQQRRCLVSQHVVGRHTFVERGLQYPVNVVALPITFSGHAAELGSARHQPPTVAPYMQATSCRGLLSGRRSQSLTNALPASGPRTCPADQREVDVKRQLMRLLASGLIVHAAMPASVPAQPAPGAMPPPPNAQPATTEPTSAQPYSNEQLDALLAPIALYPDPLLTQVLMA